MKMKEKNIRTSFETELRDQVLMMFGYNREYRTDNGTFHTDIGQKSDPLRVSV